MDRQSFCALTPEEKAHHQAIQRKHVKKHAEKYRTYQREWNRANTAKVKVYSRRGRDKMLALRDVDPLHFIKRTWSRRKATRKAQGKEFSIEFSDLVWPTHCPILGLELDYTNKAFDNGWSLDRYDNSLGYVKGNVYVISRRANILKSDGTAEEHRCVARWMCANAAE